MFIQFIFHNIVGFIISLNLFCILEYISDPDNFTLSMYNYSVNIGLWAFDKIVSIKMLYDSLHTRPFIRSLKKLYRKNISKNTDKQYDDDNDITNGNTEEIEIMYNIDGEIIICDRNGLYNDKYYKECEFIEYFKPVSINERIYFVGKNVENIIIPKEAPVFSMTLKYNDIEYDIYDRMRKYFVDGNIFNYSFFIAFMKKYYNVLIDNQHIMVGAYPIIPFTISYLDKTFTNKTLKYNETITIHDSFITSENEGILEIKQQHENDYIMINKAYTYLDSVRGLKKKRTPKEMEILRKKTKEAHDILLKYNKEYPRK